MFKYITSYNKAIQADHTMVTLFKNVA